MNITAGLLFRQRMVRYWRYQISVWRTALDWTVWLYLLIPGLWIGGGTYLEWWRNPPDWMIGFPLIAAAIPPLILIFTGGLRVFLEEGDMLFLLQRQSWIRGLVRNGFFYTMAIQAFTTILMFFLLLPLFMKGCGLEPADVLVWGLFTFLSKLLFTVLKNIAGAAWRGWRGAAVTVLLSLVVIAGYLEVVRNELDNLTLLIAVCAVSVILIAVCMRTRIRLRGAFDTDIQRETKAKMRSTELLLTQGGFRARKPVITMNRPFVFRRSGRIFKGTDTGTVLAEMRIKAFVRKLANIRMWFSFLSVATAAILLSPGWLSLFLLVLLPIPAAVWLHRHWKEWFDESFVAQFNWDDHAAQKGASLSRYWLFLPIMVWISLVAGLHSGGAAGLLLTTLCGAAGWWVFNKMLGEILAVRKK